MYKFEQYTENKTALLESMDVTKAKFMELDSYGLDVEEAIRKIENAKAVVQNDKISIVLVGAFSDGKTSVAAGWMNEKLSNMKIDTDESSDEILCYTPSSIPEGCQIVDTPGLFGDKVGSDENGGVIRLSKKTEKYISEANLVLYVVPAKNPIKDSHREFIKKLLMDMNKLSSTIFVVNRMDDVADMTDDDDYALQSRIKSENVRGKLLNCGLSHSDVEKVKIACISAAPGGRGIEEWKEYREEYLKRSRLSTLEAITNKILEDTRAHLLVKTGCDILNHEIQKALDSIREQVKFIETSALPNQRDLVKRSHKDLDQLAKRLLRNRGEIKDELRVLEKQKLAVIRSATLENFRDVMDEEIGLTSGHEGERLGDDIECIFERYSLKNAEWTNQVGQSLESQYQKNNDLMEVIKQQGTNALVRGLKNSTLLSTDTIKKGIFAGRDLLGKVGKTIKFKPWQVTKMANFCTKAMPIVGGVVDVISDVVANAKEKKRNREFESAKDDMKAEIQDLFKGITDGMKEDSQYFADFAPEYEVLRGEVERCEKEASDLEQLLKSFKSWEKKLSPSDMSLA